MRTWIAMVVAALAATGLGLISPAVAAEEPYCGVYWGSLAKEREATSVAPLVDVRAGQHECFDRLVLDFEGEADGYRVEYVPEVRLDGSGDVLPVRGGARLQVILRAPAHDACYNPTFLPADPSEAADVTGWRTFRQIAFGGTFEGQTELGLGVRARLPFRVFTLDGPGAGSRIVIDVAHRW